MSNQRDVAKMAGLSSASVSRYLNNPDSVSERTAGKIQNAIEELGYRIDHSARTLKTGVFHRIGIISASFGPFYWEILSAIEQVLSRSGYFVNIYFTRKSHNRNDYHVFNMNMINNRQVDGFIVFPLLRETDDQIISHLTEMDENFVVVDRIFDDPSVYQVAVDNYQAGREAAKALLERGHRELLFIWGLEDMASSFKRYEGFRDQLGEDGVEWTQDREFHGFFDAENTYNCIISAGDGLPEFDGVFASNDFSAIGFMKAMHEMGKESPRDYSIIGFDDHQISPYLTTPLSSFSQPLTDMGTQAARMLLDKIKGNQVSQNKVLFKPELILRESLGEKK